MDILTTVRVSQLFLQDWWPAFMSVIARAPATPVEDSVQRLSCSSSRFYTSTS